MSRRKSLKIPMKYKLSTSALAGAVILLMLGTGLSPALALMPEQESNVKISPDKPASQNM